MGNKKVIKVRYRLSVIFFGTVLIFGLMFYKYLKSTTLEDVLSEERTITVFSENTVKKGSASDSPDGESDDLTDGAEPTSSAEVINPVPESEAVGEDYLDGCVFIGDNITYGLASYGIVPSGNVLASASLSVTKIDTAEIDTASGKKTVIEAVSELLPEKVYVMLGSNGAAYSTPSELYISYSSFLNKLRIASPDSKIFIISTPPVTKSKEDSKE